MMESRKLALLCRELADDKKAESPVVLDVSKISSVTDYFVIVTGTSEPHLRAILGEITDGVREKTGLRPYSMDGSLQTSWMVLDYFDVIVHIMRPEVRERYDLEGLWNDASRVDPSKPKKDPKAPKAPRKAPKKLPKKAAVRPAAKPKRPKKVAA